MLADASPGIFATEPGRRHYMQEAQHRMQYAPVQGSEMVGMVDNNGHYSALYKKTQPMFVEVQAQPVMVDQIQAVQLVDAQPVRHLRPSHYWSHTGQGDARA